MQPYVKSLKRNAQKLRREQTTAEITLWNKIRRKQLLGLQFYRQKPLLTYIVDFYCPVANLVIELDGGQHYEKEHQVNDIVRDNELRSLGLTVLRFDNITVMAELENVIEYIYQHLLKKLNRDV